METQWNWHLQTQHSAQDYNLISYTELYLEHLSNKNLGEMTNCSLATYLTG